MKLYSLLIESAEQGGKIQRPDGSLPPGHNGPWNDPDTPVRNTANWLKVFLFAYEKTNDKRYIETGRKALDYLLSSEARPYGKIFHCRTTADKDKSNGLIGQAWVIEALVKAYYFFKSPYILKIAQDVFLSHEFDFGKGLWFIMDIDGTSRGICRTYNQQLWFAVVGLDLLGIERNSKIERMVNEFFKKFMDYFSVYQNGAIKHSFRINESFLRGLKDSISCLLLRKNKILSFGYHSFNLYAFSILKERYPDSDFCNFIQFQKALQFIETKEYEDVLKNNGYAFDYNIAGIEIAYVLSVFKKNSEKQQKHWIERQFIRNYDFEKKLLCKNTNDPDTLSARIYEASRLPNLDIEI